MIHVVSAASEKTAMDDGDVDVHRDVRRIWLVTATEDGLYQRIRAHWHGFNGLCRVSRG
jgi:hypothetical protein